jgi:hypothetical protein
VLPSIHAAARPPGTVRLDGLDPVLLLHDLYSEAAQRPADERLGLARHLVGDRA